MTFFEYIRSLFKRAVPPARLSSTRLPVGRTSTDTGNTFLLGNAWVVQPPADAENFWRLQDIDTNNLDAITPQELLDLLADLSPDISFAIWNFIRLCNPGHEVKIYKPGTKEIDLVSQQHIDNFILLLRDKYGSFDVVLARLFIGAYLRGAFCAELVLDGEGRESVDLATPDPFSVRFRRKSDPILGMVWQPGQWQFSQFVPLDIPTFKYIPIDPMPGVPYGRSLASPALFTAIFLLSAWHDIKRVIMQQGYKRMDIVLNTEMAMENYNYDSLGKTSFGAYINSIIDSIKTVYSQLQPDDAFIHGDMFTLSSPVGTIDSDSIGAIDKIIDRLEGTITRALKTNRVVQDTGDNTNETDSNRKWEIHAAGIKSLQHLCENLLESLFSLSLQAAGLQGTVEFRLAELRASEMFRDEQTQQLKTQNARDSYDAGYVSQDEASIYATGHPADQQTPRAIRNSETPLVQDNNSGNEDLSKKQNNKASSVPDFLDNVPERTYLNGKNREN